MIGVLLADDHPAFREGVRRTLERAPDIKVLGETATGDTVVALIKELRPDVLLLDIAMPGPGYLAVLREIMDAGLRVRVLMSSGHDEADYAIPSLRSGAAGYIAKSLSGTELVEAVRRVHAGRRYVSPGLAEQLAGALGPEAELAPHLMLSARELEVLGLIASGMSLKEIAAKLDISPKTASSYRARVVAKLGVKTNAEVVRYALEHDLMVG